MIRERLHDFQEIFHPYLQEFCDTMIADAQIIGEASTGMTRRITQIVLQGGKRFRPALAYYAYRLYEQELNENIYHLGVALEFFHTYGLIHDDIIDKSLIRRGKPTIEAEYLQLFDQSPRQYHLSLSAAILAGDLVHVYANRSLARIQVSPTILQPLLSHYQDMELEVHLGQIDDTLGVGLTSLSHLDRDMVLQMLDYKSGRYSIQKPLLLGAILSGNNQHLDLLSEIGIRLGKVFQIVDDILGTFGSEEESGKSNTSDIIEGKRTLLIIDTYNSVGIDDQARIEEILGTAADPGDIDWLKKTIENSGTLQKLKDFCHQEVLQITELIQKNLPDNASRQFLVELAQYLIERQK